MKWFALFVFTVVSSSVFSGEGSGAGVITELYTNIESGKSVARIKFSTPVKGLSCGGEGYYILEMNETLASGRMYATLLAAFNASSRVSFWVAGCTEKKYWGATRPKITTVTLHR